MTVFLAEEAAPAPTGESRLPTLPVSVLTSRRATAPSRLERELLLPDFLRVDPRFRTVLLSFLVVGSPEGRRWARRLEPPAVPEVDATDDGVAAPDWDALMPKRSGDMDAEVEPT